MKGQTSVLLQPEHEPELRDEHEEERDEPHPKSRGGGKGYAEVQNDPPCRMPRETRAWNEATMVTASMIGASISSAILVPTRGTTHNVRMVPSTKPAPNTRAK